MPGEDPNVHARVGELERGFAEMRADMRGISTILAEIKSGIASARPAWWVIAPIAVSIIVLIAAGVLAFGSVRGDIARFDTLKDVRDRQIDGLQSRLDRSEARQWEELRTDRDRERAR